MNGFALAAKGHLPIFVLCLRLLLIESFPPYHEHSTPQLVPLCRFLFIFNSIVSRLFLPVPTITFTMSSTSLDNSRIRQCLSTESLSQPVDAAFQSRQTSMNCAKCETRPAHKYGVMKPYQVTMMSPSSPSQCMRLTY